MSKFWKIFIPIASVFVVGVIGFMIYLNWNGIKGIVQGTKYYTYEEVQNAYDKGYSDSNAVEFELKEQVASYKSLVSTYSSENANLKLQNSRLISQNTTLTATNADLSLRLNTVQTKFNFLQSYLDQVIGEDECVVVFQLDGNVYDIKVIEKGTLVSVVNPSSTNTLQFNYWMVNGEQIDLTSYYFNDFTTVVANVTHKHTATFFVDGEVYETQYVAHNSKLTKPIDPEDTSDMEFIGWKINPSSNEYVDFDSFVVTDDVSLYAVFGYYVIGDSGNNAGFGGIIFY